MGIGRGRKKPESHLAEHRTMGFTIEVTEAGTGVKPARGQTVTVHCTGYVVSTGYKFWSTKDPGQSPFSFAIGLGQVIKGWDQGVAQMSLGEHATLTVTPDFGYGKDGFPAWKIPQNADLRFEIELLSIS